MKPLYLMTAVGTLVAIGALVFGPSRLLPETLMASDSVPAGRIGIASPLQTGAEVPLSLNILVDQFGYRPQDPKVAVIRSPRIGFDAHIRFEPGPYYEVRRVSDNQAIYKGELAVWGQGKVQESSGDVGWWFDFSEVKEDGEYYVYDVARAVRSDAFRVGADVYDETLRAAVRTFFYQRSAFAKTEPFAERCWTDAPAYVGKRQDTEARLYTRPEDASTQKDLSGGWFDAGDTNKYTTFASEAVHQLLSAYRDHPESFGDDLNIPESGNGIPDLIDEIKWELDWLMKMQQSDGSALLKVGVVEYVAASPPSKDKTARFYVGPCTSSTIAVAGMFAHAALVVEQFAALKPCASELLERSRQAWTTFQRAEFLQSDCDDGTVKAGDADWSEQEQRDVAVVAAIYLFAKTGEKEFGDYIKAHVGSTEPMRGAHGGGWTRYRPETGEALLFYTTINSADAEVAGKILARLRNQSREQAKNIYGFDNRDLYRNHLATDQYHWGSNVVRTRTGNANVNLVRYEALDGAVDEYVNRGLETLHYLHGVNPLGIVYLSNMYSAGAAYSVNEMYHTWFADGTRFDNARISECGPAPGYLVGGANKNAVKDGVPQKLSPPASQPLQKSYRDWNGRWPESSWAVTEPSISYQAAYIRLLAAFAGGGRTRANSK